MAAGCSSCRVRAKPLNSDLNLLYTPHDVENAWHLDVRSGDHTPATGALAARVMYQRVDPSILCGTEPHYKPFMGIEVDAEACAKAAMEVQCDRLKDDIW